MPISPRRVGLKRQPTIEEVRSSFSARLNELCDDDPSIPPKGRGRQTFVGKLFGVGQKGARKWLESEGLPELQKVVQIATYFAVQVEWLISGRGDREIRTTLRDDHRKLIKAYEKAVPADRMVVDLTLKLKTVE